MLLVRTLGWLLCVVYSTIPLFWLMVHPRAHRWRQSEGSPFRVLVPAWIVMCIMIYSSSGAHFSWRQLGGLPELRPGNDDQRLITTGIRSRVRHPIYLAHLCEMLAWSVGTGLAVCWLLTAFAIATGAVMIRMEDAELEKRFGAGYVSY